MIGSLAKKYMREHGIKQNHVAEKMGVSAQTLGQILNENRKIETKEFFDLCDAIGVDAAEFAHTAGVYRKTINLETAKNKKLLTAI